MMTNQNYKQMIDSIVVPGTLSTEEQSEKYKPFIEFQMQETPNQLYRFRSCSERHLSAFEQDQLWISLCSKMNDDFDALLYFSREEIRRMNESFLKENQIQKFIEVLGKAEDIPYNIQNTCPTQILEVVHNIAKQMTPEQIQIFRNQLEKFLTDLLNLSFNEITHLIQNVLKIASFSEAIHSSAMWGYYADEGRGFALAYDFRNSKYPICMPSNSNCQSCSKINYTLGRVIYDDTRLDATDFARWLFQQKALKTLLAQKNLLPLWDSIQNFVPCPDLFMSSKIALHKATAWAHEKEWRLICSCNSNKFNQKDHTFLVKRPSAVYLGRNISAFYEKIIRNIAIEKNIPVYKMELHDDETTYNLYPEQIQSVI